MRAFNSKPYVDVRELYEKGGELMPGKKGMSLDSNANIQFASICKWL